MGKAALLWDSSKSWKHQEEGSTPEALQQAQHCEGAGNAGNRCSAGSCSVRVSIRVGGLESMTAQPMTTPMGWSGATMWVVAWVRSQQFVPKHSALSEVQYGQQKLSDSGTTVYNLLWHRNLGHQWADSQRVLVGKKPGKVCVCVCVCVCWGGGGRKDSVGNLVLSDCWSNHWWGISCTHKWWGRVLCEFRGHMKTV